MKLHHLHQAPVAGMNQRLKFFRPFTGRGIGVVVWRHEFSLTLGDTTR